MKIAVYGRTFDQSFIPYIDKFLNCLEENSVEVIFYKPFYEFAKGQLSLNDGYSTFFDSRENFDF